MGDDMSDITFKDIAEACKTAAQAGRIGMKQRDPDLISASSPLFDLGRTFRQEDGAYDYRVHTAPFSKSFIADLLSEPQASNFEPVRFFLANSASPNLRDLVKIAARGDAFFLIVGPFPARRVPDDLGSLVMSDMGMIAMPLIALVY